MYCILVKNKGKTKVDKISWHVNDRKPVLLPGQEILELFADGEELYWIERRFQNLPIAYGYCTWQGEMAQFVFKNL